MSTGGNFLVGINLQKGAGNEIALWLIAGSGFRRRTSS
jgi:hypothetical protein